MKPLTYRQARSIIKNGDIVFIRNQGTFVHHLISLFTRSVHVHVGIAFWNKIGNYDHLMIVEADRGSNRRVVNLSFYCDHDIDVIEAPIEWDLIQDNVLRDIGEAKYEWLEAIYVGISETFDEFFGVKLPKVEFPGEICSKFVASNIGLSERFISPSGLFVLLLEQGSQIRTYIRKNKRET